MIPQSNSLPPIYLLVTRRWSNQAS
uniref:Uncharacterized protein n=1 Tax=Arundo donax TaxID=35708 RepID=A0A0A9FJX7_ARUDO